jgi:hypothetical protein
MRTARSPTSGEDLSDFVMTQSSQGIGSPPNKGRFNFEWLKLFFLFELKMRGKIVNAQASCDRFAAG